MADIIRIHWREIIFTLTIFRDKGSITEMPAEKIKGKYPIATFPKVYE